VVAVSSEKAVESQELNGKVYSGNDRVLLSADGRLVGEMTLGRGLRLLLAGGHKTRYPTLKELYSDAVGGNPDLEAERAWMTEAGGDLSGWPLKTSAFEVRVFGNWLSDVIDKPRDTFRNVGRARTAGVEVGMRLAAGGPNWAPEAEPSSMDLRVEAQPAWDVRAWYTFLDARDTETDRALDYRSRHSAAMDVRVRTWPGGRLSVQGIMKSGQESWYFDTLQAAWVHERLPGFMLLHARVSHTVVFSEAVVLEGYLSARNLLDTDYVVGSFDPQPGRSLFGGMELTF